MGWPCSSAGIEKSGKAAVIVTAPLAAHLRTHVQRPHFLPLPMGRKTLRRVRQLLGVDHRVWIDTRIAWWLERIDDLATLSAVKFVARHGTKGWTRKGTMSSTLVFHMRVALLGYSQRPPGWWRSQEVRTLVNSKLRLRVIAERLQVSEITVSRIRRRLREEKLG